MPSDDNSPETSPEPTIISTGVDAAAQAATDVAADADSTGDAAITPQAARQIRRVLPFTLLWAAGIIIIDQATKYWAEATLVPYEPVPVIGEWIQWRLVYNPGAAFGIGGEFTWVLTLIAAVAVVGISIFVARISSVRWALATGAMLGGAISHLGDRLFREPGFARGEIVDFIDYFGFFVGNIADIALVGGAIALVLLSLIGVSPRAPERREPDPSLEAPSAETR